MKIVMILFFNSSSFAKLSLGGKGTDKYRLAYISSYISSYLYIVLLIVLLIYLCTFSPIKQFYLFIYFDYLEWTQRISFLISIFFRFLAFTISLVLRLYQKSIKVTVEPNILRKFSASILISTLLYFTLLYCILFLFIFVFRLWCGHRSCCNIEGSTAASFSRAVFVGRR